MVHSTPIQSDPDLVTIIIPTWNRPDTACVALHTAVHQSYPKLEIIVVDDGSDIPFDSHIDDPRVRVLRSAVHHGLSRARNMGMKAARGAYIAFLDDDDWYYPDKIEKQLEFLQEHSDLDGVFSRVVVIDAAGNEQRYLPDGFIHDTFLNFRYYNIIHTNSALLRRRVCNKVQWDERLTKYTDMQFFLEVSRQFKLAYLNRDVAAWYKQDRADQVTSQPPAPKRAGRRRNCDNFKIICAIFHGTIAESLELRVRYYGRLFFSGLKARDWTCAVKSLRTLLTGGLWTAGVSSQDSSDRLGYSSGQ